MEQQPSSSGKPIQSTPVWKPQLDRVEERVEAIAAAVEQLDAQVAELGAQGTTHEGEGAAGHTMADVLHELEVVSSRMADQALDGAVSREVLQRVEATLTGFSDALSRLGESVETVRSVVEGIRTTSVANEVAISGLSGAVDDLGDRLSSTQKRMIARSHLDEVRRRVEQAEVSLAHQANVIGDALRSRIDDQRVLADELGAQVTNLNANIASSSDSPEQLRRDVRQAVESLAQRVGVAIREVRSELAQTSTSKELTTGVDAGMARLSERLRTDADQLAKAVANVHADNDERLRRLAVQMTEMQHSIELLRWSQRVDHDLSDAEAKLGPQGGREEDGEAQDPDADHLSVAGADDLDPDLPDWIEGDALPAVEERDGEHDADDDVLRAEVVDSDDFATLGESMLLPDPPAEPEGDAMDWAAEAEAEDDEFAIDHEPDDHAVEAEEASTDGAENGIAGDAAELFYDAGDDEFPGMEDDAFPATDDDEEELASRDRDDTGWNDADPADEAGDVDNGETDWGAFAPDESSLKQIRWPRQR